MCYNKNKIHYVATSFSLPERTFIKSKICTLRLTRVYQVLKFYRSVIIVKGSDFSFFFFHFVMLINNNVLPRLNLLPGKSSTLYARSGSVFGLVCCCRCFGFLLLFFGNGIQPNKMSKIFMIN